VGGERTFTWEVGIRENRPLAIAADAWIAALPAAAGAALPGAWAWGSVTAPD
jgi:hypothetical protein